MTAPAPTAFISYSRWNREFAKHLKFDLERAGISAWLDSSDILAGRDWDDAIRKGIEGASHFVLLVSPESNNSDIVVREVECAKSLGKKIIPLLIGGHADGLKHGWSDLHMLDFCRRQYQDALPELFRNLSADLTPPVDYNHFLNRDGVTVSDAAKALGGNIIHLSGREFAVIPIGPTGYATIRIIGPASEPFRLPRDVAALLHFSGPSSRRADRDVLEYLLDQSQPGWLVAVEGPVNQREARYDLMHPHVWRDGVEATLRAIEPFLKSHDVRLFMNCPVQLGFAVGLRAKDFFRSYRLYHYTGGAYQVVYEGTRS